MEYRSLGASGLTVPATGFGAAPAGGAFWVGVDDVEAMTAMQRAFDRGVTLFDTAPAYGMGHSERLLGQAMRAHRHEIIIATKFGMVWDDKAPALGLRRDSGRRSILSEVDASLQRLKTDYIDLYQQHWPDPNTPVEETMGTLVELQREGKIRHIGVSNFDVPLMEEAIRYARIASLQPPYSMLRREVEEEILPFCRQHGVGVLVYGPMHHGLLSGKFTSQSKFAKGDWRMDLPDFQGVRFERNVHVVDALKPIAMRRGVSVGQLAIAWTLMHPAVSCALVGAKRSSQVDENVGGAGLRLTDGEMKLIDERLRAS